MLRPHEVRVLMVLAAESIPAELLDEIAALSDGILVEETGHGYFVSLRHPSLPSERVVFSDPTLVGEAMGVECGFLVFVENSELTLECHSWGDEGIPQGFRNCDVTVREAV